MILYEGVERSRVAGELRNSISRLRVAGGWTLIWFEVVERMMLFVEEEWRKIVLKKVGECNSTPFWEGVRKEVLLEEVERTKVVFEEAGRKEVDVVPEMVLERKSFETGKWEEGRKELDVVV